MSVYSIYIRNGVDWILTGSAPAQLDFPVGSPFFGWALLNPLTIPKGVVSRGPTYAPLTHDRVLVSSDRIDFSVNTADQDAALATAQRILRWLRFSSGQARLGTDIVGHQLQVGDILSETLTLPTQMRPEAHPVRHVEFSALTFDLIQAALRNNPDFLVPIYSEVLLDAIEASFVSDERKAILYSAIAVEVMASSRIQEIFDKAATTANPDLRVLEMPQAGGAVVKKDPIFDELRKGSQRNFKLLLNHLPLYVQRRSMLTERQDLYRELVLLHNTRNDLVHSADVDEAERIPLDHGGMRRAINVAIQAFAWFGAAGRYVTLWSTELDAGWKAS